MTDELGPRLAASKMKLRAEQLVVDKLKSYGFDNVRVEYATDFSKGGWNNEKNYVAMTAPYYCSFATNPKAWSGSTDGLVKAQCILLEPAYQFIQDPLDYFRAYHTTMDTFERLSLDDLKVNAAIAAWVAYSAAMDNTHIPVKPGFPEKLKK